MGAGVVTRDVGVGHPGWRLLLAGPVVGVVVALVVLAPVGVVLGAGRLTAFAVLAAGAWVTVGRTGALDLAVGAAAGAGAYAGGVAAGVAGWPALVGVGLGAVAGAGLGAVVGAVGGRVGRAAGALTSLSIGLAVVAALAAWPGAGGAAGFHAVPLLAGSDRAGLAVLVAMLVTALAVGGRFASTLTASAAAVAARAPTLARSLGLRPSGATARSGALGGALLGAGGAGLAAQSGSVTPGGYGLALAAALALAALVGGAPPIGPLLGAGLLWGPGVLFPLVPVVGDAPPLLLMGPVALGVLALRRGRALVGPGPRPDPVVDDRGAEAASRPRHGRQALEATGVEVPAGTVDVRVRPGEIVALVGPNGAGKSTVLARIAGQQPRAGALVRLGGRRAPASAIACARAGLARTFQRPPDVPARDALAVAARDGGGGAAAWAARTLGAAAATPGGGQLVRAAARRPSVVLLDEPGAGLDAGTVAPLVRGLADAGAAVLIAEHRPELVAVADRAVRLRLPPESRDGSP